MFFSRPCPERSSKTSVQISKNFPVGFVGALDGRDTSRAQVVLIVLSAGSEGGRDTLSDRQKGSDARQKGSDAGQYGPVIGQCKVFTTLENYDATLIKLSDWSMQR